MALSREQFDELRKKGLSPQQIASFEAGQEPVKTKDAKEVKLWDTSGFTDPFVGAAKEAGKFGLGIGGLGRGIQKGLSKGVDKVFGTDGFGLSGEDVFDKGSEANMAAEEKLTKEGFGQKFGGGIANVAAYAIPGSAAAKATSGAGFAMRMLGQAGVAGTVTGAREGEFGKKAATSAAIGAISVPVGDALVKAATKASTSLPEWFVRPLVKQSPTAKMQGKDITSYLSQSGRIGSVDTLIQTSDDQMRVLNTQIDDILTNSNKTVNLWSVADDVAKEINRAGGATTADDILGMIGKQAYQSRGVIQNAATNQADDLSIKAANTVRSQLDDTLYSGKDYLRQVPTENKAILEAFTNKLRGTVQSSESATKPLFSTFSKEITLKQALERAAASSQGRNALNMMDVLAAGGGGIGGGPLGALGAFAGRRTFESPITKTTLAALFKNTDKAAAALETASPAIRGAVLAFVASLEDEKEEGQQDTQKQ